MAAMAALSCCGAPSASAVPRGSEVGQFEKRQLLLSTTDRYDLLGSSTNRSRLVSGASSTTRSRQTRELLGRPCAVRMESSTTETTKTKRKIAKLYVEKTQTVPLPQFADASGNLQHLRVFLREPEGMMCMLNTKALRKFEDIGDGIFKCYLPKMEFLGFEVAPVLELQVDARDESCLVDMLSCKFEGSDLIRGQNERFSASMRNHLTWSSSTQQEEEEERLHVRIELNVALEIYTLPFTMLPVSAVESPGKLVLQALVDKLIPLFVDQLFLDYRTWSQSQNAANIGDDSPGVRKQLDGNGSTRDCDRSQSKPV